MRLAYLVIFVLILGAGCVGEEKKDGQGPQISEPTHTTAPVTTAPAVVGPTETLTVVERVQLINDTLEIDNETGEFIPNDSLDDKNPSWSPDGDRIVFESKKMGSWDIWIMDIKGENMNRLTSDDVTERSPEFSPDGKKIAFERHEKGRRGIWIMDSDGKNMKELVRCDKNCMSPSWSPDGKKIIYAILGDLWTVDVATGATSQITGRGSVNDLYPSWSPDGKKIAYTSTESGTPEIWVMNADGSNKKQLTDKSGMDISPVWSPDGKWIVFESQGGIWAMSREGSNPHTLVREYKVIAGSPSWSPDGNSIVIHSNRAGTQDIWILKIKLEKG